MTGKNKLKARLKKGETISAAWLELGSPEVAELMVRAGWDVIVIDCEHGAAGLEDGLALIRAVEAAGGQAVVRVPDAQEATLKRALDRGARSIMVPMVHTIEGARDIAQCCLYAPRGRRGYAAPIVRASDYGTVADYAKAAHEELLLMIQIEHIDAVRNVEELAQIDGLDMAFVGPNDLAASMNHLEDLEHPDVRGAIAKVEDTARETKLMMGTITGAGRGYGDLKAAGYQFIVGPSDLGLLVSAAQDARRVRDADLSD